ncbi:hypothetical protein FQY83_11900 [Luteimonas marina]|uniref:Uncharacterized protein n=1 Tax=Luteimonas marina TaxID=488485 RepID=A0A5C5U004_9GAMM|nr:hypothetical protein [Luteimonas marina]TWT19068.1 hypothetical protein FQY83_11900 [Luteimonas marina]
MAIIVVEEDGAARTGSGSFFEERQAQQEVGVGFCLATEALLRSRILPIGHGDHRHCHADRIRM